MDLFFTHPFAGELHLRTVKNPSSIRIITSNNFQFEIVEQRMCFCATDQCLISLPDITKSSCCINIYDARLHSI